MRPRLRIVLIVLALYAVVQVQVNAGQARMVRARMAFIYQGPGSYYPRYDVVRRNAVIEVGEHDESGRWLKVASYPMSASRKKKMAESGNKGAGAPSLWVAERALFRVAKEMPQERIELAQQTFHLDELTASHAIRGLGELTIDGIKTRQIDKSTLAYILVPPFTPRQYLAFRTETIGRRKLPDVPLSWNPSERFDVQTRVDMGNVIASKMLTRYGGKPVTDVSLNRYVNMVAAFLAEQSPAYDLNIRVLIVKSDKISSMSAPGGVVLVTDALLKACKSEAELAGVLAHEFVHISRGHGLLEPKQVKKTIGIDLAKLEKELDEEFVKRHKGEKPPWARPTFDGLDVMATEFLERTLLRGYRIEEEDEADAYGTVFLYTSGYDTKAMADFIGRVLQREVTTWPIGMEMHGSADERAETVKWVINRFRLKYKDAAAFEERYKKHIAVLTTKEDKRPDEAKKAE